MTLSPSRPAALDVLSLGEVMLRFDPGMRRIHTTRSFDVSEGGGEYNVARALRRCFGLRCGIITALVDNPLGRLLEDLMLQGGLDLSGVRWITSDAMGVGARVGLNFVERGFGPRTPLGCSDRANTAISQLRVGDIDFASLFAGVRLFHTGGVFAALSTSSAEVAAEAMQTARAAGCLVSYDLNYRPSLWAHRGGPQAAQAVNRELLAHVDILFGDFSTGLGIVAPKQDYATLRPEQHEAQLRALRSEYPQLRYIANGLRQVHSASCHAWGGVALLDDEFVYQAPVDCDVYDRVGSGDAFAAGLLYGLLDEKSAPECLQWGVAHGALVMSTPGDTSMSSRAEVAARLAGASAAIAR